MTEREFQKELSNYHDTENMSVKLAVELLNGANLECLYDDETYYARDMAIKALEQEDVLGKVRAEIESEIISHSGTGEEVIQAYVDGLLKAVEIIDKYRKENAEC